MAIHSFALQSANEAFHYTSTGIAEDQRKNQRDASDSRHPRYRSRHGSNHPTNIQFCQATRGAESASSICSASHPSTSHSIPAYHQSPRANRRRSATSSFDQPRAGVRGLRYIDHAVLSIWCSVGFS
ncbi:uncharacterized protein LOC129749069 [Uranotaenia lowii]|uniref:uncharacterized protein LOC129739529 n=1 Tax=Uranotaenia lowii TaxID=190385 RepID=UPI00247AD1F3|nr:uncharacterized protein LOC129739529 [Uranotaenia lowii]XP_055587234.1 uncharacterized protein LOC129739749 [Uranotaenia lowii]XP_055599885.1 uncharacterized protein LOC129749069 [Uranotaenia lowii]